MTISDLKRALDANLAKTVIVPSKKNDLRIHVSFKDWNTAKYACTMEETDFKYIGGHVFYKGFELSRV